MAVVFANVVAAVVVGAVVVGGVLLSLCYPFLANKNTSSNQRR